MMAKNLKMNKEIQKVTDSVCEKNETISYIKPEAEIICKKRYYQKDENGVPFETWADLVWRVVNYVCKNESEDYKKKIYNLILQTKFLPNSPCLVNAGSKSKSAGLLACFVTPPPADCWCGKDETIPTIGMTENIENFGHIARRGGGAGVNFSNIRPEGDSVFGSTHAKACGPIEHMRMISEVMYSITQSGFRGMACATYDTMVSTEKGFIQIGEIFEKKMTGIGIYTQFGDAKITKVWKNGIKEVFEIITQRGNKVKLTADHKVYVIESYNGKNHGKLSKKINTVGKWKEVKELKPNDCLVINIREKPFSKEYQYINGMILDEEMAALISYIKCDGLFARYGNSQRVSLSLDSEESINLFKSNKYFNFNKPHYRDNGLAIMTKDGVSVEFLKHFGEFGTYHCDIPKEIFKSPKSVVAAFLRSAFDAEGTVLADGQRCYIATGMTSQKFIDDIQILLGMFGIQSSVRRDVVHVNKDGRTRQNMNYLQISNKWHVKKFMDEIGFISNRKNKIARESVEKEDFSGEGRGKVYSCKIIHRIKSIQSLGEDTVYDISTSNETFLANNIVVHNCLGALNINHPDIFNFITCKQRERALKTALKEDFSNHYNGFSENIDSQLQVILDKFIYNFNISVVATDDFMKRVENDEDFNLEFGGKIYKTIKARELFDAIAENAWRNGDPGFLFYDRMNEGPYKYSKQEINATNPCFHGDSMVAVADGRNFVSIKQLAEEGKDVPVYCCDKKTGKRHIRTGRNPRKTKENAELCKIIFDDGGSILVTPDHKILLKNGEYKEAKELKSEDSVVSFSVGNLKIVETANENKCIVSSIIVLSEKADVYNITVDDYHNLYILNNYEIEHNGSSFTAVAAKNCGEQNLPPNGSCNLGSLDISKFYDEKTNNINWSELKEAVALSVRFLDCVIDINRFPTKDFEKWAKENRPVGLGIMGWADLLLKMKLSYGKKRSLELAEELMSFMYKEAHRVSVELAKEKGTPKACEYKELENRRNVTLLSVAPTGTISQIASCSSSIEPVFCPTIYRTDNTGSRQVAYEDSDKPYFRCAVDPEKKEGREVTYEEHILMQTTFQKNVCSAISKTINLPNSATVEDVKKAYMMAWKKGAKGVTIYRDMSKSTQVLNTSDKTIMQVSNAQKRPKKIEADIFCTKALGKDWHIIIGKVNNKPYELFAVNGSVDLPEKAYVLKNKSRHYSLVGDKDEIIIDNIIKTEKDIDINIDKETRRFSLELRHGIPPKYIVEQIDKSNDYMYSLSKAISRIFATKYITVDEFVKKPCPVCAERGVKTPMILSAGCWKCSDESCGYSKCG